MSVTPLNTVDPSGIASLLAISQDLPGQEEEFQLDYSQFDDGENYLSDNPIQEEVAVSLLDSNEDQFQEEDAAFTN